MTTMKQTQRKPAGIRRREIASAVLHLIGELGAPALTAARIADAVGVTPGALFRHFKTVDEILAATVDLAIEMIEETFPPEDLAPLQRLGQLLSARIAIIQKNRGLAWLLLSDQVFLTVPPQAVKRLRALVKRSRTYLLSALEAGVEQGELRADIPTDVMLVLFTGCVHTLAGPRGVHAAGSKSVPTPPKSAKVIETLLELLGP